jgi:beta-amylase
VLDDGSVAFKVESELEDDDDDDDEQSPEQKHRRLAPSRSASDSLADLRVSVAATARDKKNIDATKERTSSLSSSSSSFFEETYGTAYGKHFLSWYASELAAHADRVLERVRDAFHRVGVAPEIGVKCPGVHWWVNHPKRAAECAAGYYNDEDNDQGARGYADVVQTCAKFNASLTFTCVEMRDSDHDAAHKCSPEKLLKQVLRECARKGVRVHGENALLRLDEDAYAQILRTYGRGEAPSSEPELQPERDSDASSNVVEAALSSFTFLRSCDALYEEDNFARFTNFVRRMSAST